jgi:hypothetical protein
MPPSVSRLSREIVGVSTSHSPTGIALPLPYLYHEDKWGSRAVAVTFLTCALDGGEWSVPATLSPWKEPLVPVDKRLGGPQGWFKPCGEVSCPCRDYIEPILTELSPSWGAISCAATQELPSISWNPKVQCRIHKSPPLVPILSHLISLRSILILSTHLRLGLPSGLFPSGFPTNILYAFLFSPYIEHIRRRN